MKQNNMLRRGFTAQNKLKIPALEQNKTNHLTNKSNNVFLLWLKEKRCTDM